MQYTREERHALERLLNTRAPLVCPACGSPVSAQAVPPPPEVSYVRHRVWIVCPQCKRSASVDSNDSRTDKNRPNKSTQ